MGGRFAVKRLAAVEIDPDRSNQHEFNAGHLRSGLGFASDSAKGRLRLLIYPDDGGEPVVDDDRYTLYDARARHPTRSEWHLYYYSAELASEARVGDLLVLYRPDGGADLHGVVVRSGSERAERLLDALLLRDEEILAEFRLVDAPETIGRPATRLGEALVGETADIEPSGSPYPTRDHPIVTRAVREGSLPDTATMAGAAAALMDPRRGTSDPDGYLFDVMEAETALFNDIETAIGGARLAELVDQDAPLRDVLNWAMSIHQARRSRRGQSLQHHFAEVLQASGIPYAAQCTTEDGETPDFVVPGCVEYHDERFPVDRLRMVACKTTSKERWRQILNEAARIDQKYLLTIDGNLTAAVIGQMHASRLHPFLPAQIIQNEYATNPERDRLGSVRELVGELRSAVNKHA